MPAAVASNDLLGSGAYLLSNARSIARLNPRLFNSLEAEHQKLFARDVLAGVPEAPDLMLRCSRIVVEGVFGALRPSTASPPLDA